MKKDEILEWLDKYNKEDKHLDLENQLEERIRTQGFLTKEDLTQLIEWRYRDERRRLFLKWNEDNEDLEIKDITKNAINSKDEKEKIKLLCKIRGVGIPLASCILAFYNPEKYCIFDIHIYDEIFNTDHKNRPKYFSSNPKYYLELLEKLRKLSEEYSLSIRDIEKALFKKNYEESKDKHIFRIHDMPEQNRPRERFLKFGPEALSDSELFAIILRIGSIHENVIDMSNRLINEYGLDKLFECSLKELQKINGIGPTKAIEILTIAELGKRHSQSKTPIKKITCAEDVFHYFHERLKDKKEEHFYVLMLNTQNNIIGEHLISKGILDASIIHPREVFKPAIKNSASKIILVHNHPSGDCFPSKDDLSITKALIEFGEKLEIKVADHIILGNNNWWNWRGN